MFFIHPDKALINCQFLRENPGKTGILFLEACSIQYFDMLLFSENIF